VIPRLSSSRLARGCLAAALACAAALAPAAQAGAPRPNVVLIVLDDFGVENLEAFRGPDDPPSPCAPHLETLAREGLLFRNAWTNPVCSPSRAQILTGRHGFRTGIGQGIAPESGTSLRVDLHDPLPRALAGYDSSAVGKWHLVSLADGTRDHPLDAGFRYYAGSLFNLAEAEPSSEACRGVKKPLSYWNWLKTYDLDGSGRMGTRCWPTYATTDTVDEAILRAKLMEPPWFLYVAFNAPHWPVHEPPEELCPDVACERIYCRERPRAGDDVRADRIRAMIEALDVELGRFLAELRVHAPDTLVLVIGDNGGDHVPTEDDPGATAGLAGRAKSTLYQGGVHVPLLAWGPGVVAGECDALVSSTDLYATIAELAGERVGAEDSVSLVPYLRGAREPLRRTVYAEVFTPNQPDAALGQPFAPTHHARTVRDERFKLVRISTPEGEDEQLYDLRTDPGERVDLMEGGADALAEDARAHLAALRAELAAMGLE
jgi:arylsulfatase B